MNVGDRQFLNGYDDSTTVMRRFIDPTYLEILDLPDHTEVMCLWPDGTTDGYDVDQEFKRHMMEQADEKNVSLDTSAGVLVMVAVTPDKMHPNIVAALLVMERTA